MPRLRHLIEVRRQTAAFAGNHMEVVSVGNEHVFGYVRAAPAGAAAQRVLVLANFSEAVQTVDANEVRLYGLGYRFTELTAGKTLALGDGAVALEPYQVMWLLAEQ